MGARGRKPKPTALKRLDGTYRADRAAAHEPKPVGLPSCPRFLSDDGRREFRRVTKMLAEMGLIGRIDGNALARYAATWARCAGPQTYSRRLASFKSLRTKKGSPKLFSRHPLDRWSAPSLNNSTALNPPSA